MDSGYDKMALSMSSGIIVKDPTLIHKFIMPEESKRATMITLVEYYKGRIIPEEEAERMKYLIESPDEENMQVVQSILEQKYKLF